jgi:Cu2+-exporting ATPase
MRCANCASAIERAVSALEGVKRVSVNAATARASVEWDSDEITLSRILDAIRKAGFKPIPFEGEEAAAAERRERRVALKRIGIAGLGMMQTMMFVYALYAGGNHGVNTEIAQYLRVAGMLLTTPVLVYSGVPFFSGALRDLREHRLGMDVPVAMALLLAFVASVVHTLQGSGEIYYDSVTMFIFLLSLGRFAEMTVRQRSLSASEAFARSVPATAVRVRPDGSTERVPVRTVAPGDRLRVARGAVIPVDCKLSSSDALVDESLVTGESRPVAKARDGDLLGGSINTGDPIEVVCAAPADSSTLANIVALLRRAGAERPKSVAVADRAASLFSLITVLLAAAVAFYWGVVEPTYAMTATLAVLVVTCPCALSLATPAAFAAVTTRLARLGMLVVKPDAIERLARIDTVVLDKTGTLTDARLSARVESVRPGYSGQRALAIAAALERASDHPLAQAFADCADSEVRATEVREFVGRGVEGHVDGCLWRLGRADFVAELATSNSAQPVSGSALVTPDPVLPVAGMLPPMPGASSRTAAPTLPRPTLERSPSLALGAEHGIVATIDVRDEVSAETQHAIEELRRHNLKLAIASGDSEAAVKAAANALGITEYHARMDFTEKREFVRQLQASGEGILMVGDGINDGPVLASANVSCALIDGSAVAQSAADLLLLNRSLHALAEGVTLARRARDVARQNLGWALIYNVTMVPLAAAGCVAPWVAALGMSISSLAVVLNSARLARARSP